MTPAECLDLVKEIRALERLEAVLQRRPDRAEEWTYALNAIADRLAFDRYGLAHADPALVAQAEARLAAERAIEGVVDRSALVEGPDGPRGVRVY